MKLATLDNGTPDGELILVSRDLLRAVPASGIVATLQCALEQWDTVVPQLQSLADELESGDCQDQRPFDVSSALAPLPRAWQWLDGSAYESHGDLMAKVFKRDPLPRDRPLMYQGMSDHFYSATADIPLPTEDDDIDFEGEFGVITDRVPMGTSTDDAMGRIRLLVQINDWSLRRLAPIEMKTGFGWVHAKPACSMAPVAVTPDELGESWRNGRVALPLEIWWNDRLFGQADGYPMLQGFHELVAHAAYSRDLVAGTIIGSGTVSNDNYREIGSSCIAEKRAIELLDSGEARTPYMRFGDRVRMEATLADGAPLFGAIDQRIVPHRR
jgi:2-keto-4-pentenoate hydratase/2-oxohepta-3-ene-1,7-dioic acid hydratase in catechol pathway